MVRSQNGVRLSVEGIRPVESLTEILSLLARVQSLRFDARTEAATGWEGVGIGTVAVSEPAAGVVVFEEVGSWQPSAINQGAIRFKNVFRWSALVRP
ncbi:MAG: hypothetical protein ABIZ36_09750 [Gemmatimonadaceae bacterium]